jgi:nucleoside-diphosphate-sugar epimerase
LTRFQHLIITGGTGYIGKCLVQHAIAAGIKVTLLARTNAEQPLEANFIRWNLGDALPFQAMKCDPQSTALIHLAHDWGNSPSKQTPKVNLNLTATKILLDSCRALGVARFVFVSSVSARNHAPNIYGRVKWETEQLLEGEDVVSARVGLVYGGPCKGMYGLLNKLARLPMVPMVSPSQLVQPIHMDELCSGLILLANSECFGWKGLANPVPITFGNVLKNLARIGYGKRLVVLPIPLSLALFGCYLTRFIPVVPVIDKERVLGLAGTKVLPTHDDIEELGLTIKLLERGLNQSSVGTKGLLREGNVLLRYLLGKRPSYSLLQRYVKAVRLISCENEPLGLPSIVIGYPALLRLIEPINSEHPLAKRIAIAGALAEASLNGFYTFQPRYENVRGRAYLLMRLAVSICIDICIRPIRILFNHRNE